MSSGDLIPNDHDHFEPVANEVQFALVIARMIDTVKNSPKLQEQFTHADAKDIQRAQQALERVIRGVEEFSKQQIDIPPPSPAPLRRDGSVSRSFPAADPAPPDWLRQPARQIDTTSAVQSALGFPVWPIIKRAAAMLIILGGVFVVNPGARATRFRRAWPLGLSKADCL
jgi:hypothetical protein